jgi:hypothetical protein
VGQLRFAHAVETPLADLDAAASTRSSPATKCMSVLLPLPDSPIKCQAAARRQVQVDPGQHRQWALGWRSF